MPAPTARTGLSARGRWVGCEQPATVTRCFAGRESEMDVVAKAVEECARAAKRAAPSLATASEQAIDAALFAMAERLLTHREKELEAHRAEGGKPRWGG